MQSTLKLRVLLIITSSQENNPRANTKTFFLSPNNPNESEKTFVKLIKTVMAIP
jgi:hypothetical protein